jgi:DNA anti-recombination protein RmuC
MGLSASKIRRIIERHPLPDKHLNDILQQWMIELAEELADNLLENVEASDKLASKEDIQQIRSDIKEMRQETKDDIKQLIEMSNARFESLRQEMNARFEAMEKSNSARFEAMEKANAARFEALQKEMNARFEALQRQIAFMQWWFSIGGGITLLLIILKLFFPHIFPH